MLIVNGALLKMLRAEEEIEIDEMEPKRAWDDEKHRTFLTNLRAQLPAPA